MLCLGGCGGGPVREIQQLRELGGRFDLDEQQQQVVFINLSGSKITGKQLTLLQPFARLKRLWLRGVKLDDDDLDHLLHLQNLEQLVLSGTGVTNAGIQKLQKLKQLKELYFNDTQVSQQGAQKLSEALGEQVKIVF